MIVSAGPLQWPLLGADCGTADGVDPQLWTRTQAAAVEWLWAATGRRLGTREMLVRPGNARSCGVEVAAARVRLPGPVRDVTAVQTHGGTVDPGDYRVDPGGWLRLVDGSSWPLQDWTAGPGDDGYWTVSYLRGVTVPLGGQVAAGVLACELLAAKTNPNACRLPLNTVQVVRAGTTITLADLEPGTTGLPDVDRWVSSVNPARRTRRPAVWSPDLTSARMRARCWGPRPVPSP